MKKNLIIISLFYFGLTTILFSQNDSTKAPISQKYVSVEVLKPLFWFMKDLGIIIEPEFTYQHKAMLYSAAIGYSSINDQIYNELDYKNTGSYLKLGFGIQLNYDENKNRSNSIIVGANLLFSSFTEEGEVISNSSFYGNKGQIVTQKFSSRGIGTFFTYRRDFDNKFYASISPSLSIVLSEMMNEKFPVYYVPGFGIVNDDENLGISATPFSDFGEAGALGLSVKIGYRF